MKTKEGKSIHDYLHLYLGGTILSGSGTYLPLTPDRYRFIMSDPFGDGMFKKNPTKRLILRPLSDMTEEERKEIWKIVFGNKFKFHESGRTIWFEKKSLTAEPRWVLMSGVERLGIEMNGDVWADSDLNKWKFNPHEVTLYLLSKHFDLFGLIESGLAIDKTKTKSQ